MCSQPAWGRRKGRWGQRKIRVKTSEQIHKTEEKKQKQVLAIRLWQVGTEIFGDGDRDRV